MDDNTLYSSILHIHSIGRWVLLILLLIAIFRSATAGNANFTHRDNRINTILVIVADVMLLIGIYLYFVGPWGYQQIDSSGMGEAMKKPVSRFFGVEHLIGMLVAIILIHVGKAQGKKSYKVKHRRTLIFFLLALIIMLASVPWPFRAVGADRGWI
jgi:predicted membrane channel-forming protein YqfA (hemolysin III family)